MAAPTPPTGVMTATLDAMFADLLVKGDQARVDYLRNHTPQNLQAYLAYYLGVKPPAYVAPLAANVTAAGVVKGTPGKMLSVLVVTPGSGTFTMNNCATTGAANAGNQVISYTSLFAGQQIDIGFVCDTGIVVSAVPAGGQFTVLYT